jgi:hypothetical protein
MKRIPRQWMQSCPDCCVSLASELRVTAGWPSPRGSCLMTGKLWCPSFSIFLMTSTCIVFFPEQLDKKGTLLGPHVTINDVYCLTAKTTNAPPQLSTDLRPREKNFHFLQPRATWVLGRFFQFSKIPASHCWHLWHTEAFWMPWWLNHLGDDPTLGQWRYDE